MCKKLVFVIIVLGLAGSASAYSPGIVLRCDAGSGELQAGWAEVGAGWNLDVNDATGTPSGIDVKLEAGLPACVYRR